MKSEIITTLLPLAFMLIPVWIPLIGAAVGALHDRLTADAEHPAEINVRAAKERTAASRAAARAQLA